MRLLDEYKGFLQSDAYGGYDAAGRRAGVIHVGCLDHARRKFVEAVKAQHSVAGQERGLAPEALLILRKIYAVEKLAREAKMSAEQRHTLRQEKARPIWNELPHGSIETSVRHRHRHTPARRSTILPANGRSSRAISTMAASK